MRRTIGGLLRQESPLTIVREALWRWQKKSRLRSLPAQLQLSEAPVRFKPTGYFAPTLDALSPETRAAIVEYSTAVLAGEFRFLGYENAKLGFPPPWNVDFVSGKSWDAIESSQLKTVRFDGSDVKVPWELSRLQILPVMAKAWRLTGEERFRTGIRSLLSDWIRQNPVGVGVNWTIAMEAALRATSTVLTLELLAPFRPDEQSWIHEVELALWKHVLFIEAHSEFSHFIRSNHYLSNISGLFCVCSFLDGAPAEARVRRYRAALEVEIFAQTYADGGDWESSTGYHVLVTQMFTVPAMLAKAEGKPFSKAYMDRLTRMHQFLAGIASPTGRLRHLGDCDDGRVELTASDLLQMQKPTKERDALQIASYIGLGTALFGGSLLNDADASWFGLKGSAGSAQSATVFAESGIATARIGSAQVWFANIPNGIGGKGSHTHCDKLSVLLEVNGREVLIDSGTSCYTRDPQLRNRMRATSSHNTIRVDGLEQNSLPAESLFVAGNEAQVHPIRSTGDGNEFSSSCDAYHRIGVRHARSVRLEPQGLTITDHLEADEIHEYVAYLHFADEWSIENIRECGNSFSAEIRGPQRLSLVVESGQQLNVSLESSQRSRAYGQLLPAKVLKIAWKAASSDLKCVLGWER